MWVGLWFKGSFQGSSIRERLRVLKRVGLDFGGHGRFYI